MTSWGVLPDAVRQRLRNLEWDRPANLKGRLSGARAFPIRINLKPPTGREAVEALEHFQAYIVAWRSWPGPGKVEYEDRKLSQVGQHDVPVILVLETFDELAAFLGREAEARLRHWEAVFAPLKHLSPDIERVLIRNLAELEVLAVADAQKLAAVLLQLEPCVGRGTYLRALPLVGVDTKFVEQNLSLLTELADHRHNGAVQQAGGLLTWLDCLEPPRSWLLVRVLCEQLRAQLGGLDQLHLPSDTLVRTPLPGKRVLIVENTASGYALPPMEGTIAVIGGGANVGWTRAPWLADRQVGYWGDIDTWGLHYLAAVRRNHAHVQRLMMDLATLVRHQSRMVNIADPNPGLPEGLIAEEIDLYRCLLSSRYGGTCLEQERLDADWISRTLSYWSSARV